MSGDPAALPEPVRTLPVCDRQLLLDQAWLLEASMSVIFHLVLHPQLGFGAAEAVLKMKQRLARCDCSPGTLQQTCAH